MKKSFFLFLLLLIGCIGSVSATTDYYLTVDGYTEEIINSTLAELNWGSYSPPTVSSVVGNTIYFPDEENLCRFLCGVMDSEITGTINNEFPFSLSSLKASDDYTVFNEYVAASADMRVYTSINFTDGTTKTGYLIYKDRLYSGITSYIAVDGTTVTTSGTTVDWYFGYKPVVDSVYLYTYTGSAGSSRTMVYVLKGNLTGDYTYTGNAKATLVVEYIESGKHDLTINSNVDGVSVYENDELIDTVDNEGSIVVVEGTHDLTFVKEGYYNVTQSIVVGTSDLSYNLTMVTTHTPVTLAIIDSEGGLTSVNLYIDGVLTGTVGNNQDVSLPKGTHELIFEKAGYWNETKTVTVDEALTDLSIRMYPESVFFKISNTPSIITTYSNSEVNIALNIDPNDYAYGVKLYLTGQEVLDVRDSSNVQISKQDSYYLLDDFSSAKTVNVKINSGTTLGTNSLAVRVTGYNNLGTEFVTDTTIDYEILRLPLSLTVPSWCIGSNSLTVIETEGDSRTVTIKVEDSDGNIIYTDTYTLEGFETHKFNIDFDETGDYKLYIQSGDLINTYIDVNVANPVSLTTKTITANEGSTATATVSIENPFTEPQYYRITIEGDPLVNSTRVDFSVSPGSAKSQSISFTLLDELDYDSYSLPLKVYLVEESGLTEIYSDSVILNIGSSGSFIPFIDLDDGIIDTVITLVVDNPIIPGIIIIGGLGVFIFSGNKKGKKTVKKLNNKPVFKKSGKKGGK